MYATLEARLHGQRQMIGMLGCTVGPMEKGQGIVYHGNSCNLAPDNMYVPAGATLWATFNVKFPGSRTESVLTRVRSYPPGMRFR